MACLDMRPLYLVIIQYFLGEAVRAKKYSLNTKSLMVFNIGSIFLVIDFGCVVAAPLSCAWHKKSIVVRQYQEKV